MADRKKILRTKRSHKQKKKSSKKPIKKRSSKKTIKKSAKKRSNKRSSKKSAKRRSNKRSSKKTIKKRSSRKQKKIKKKSTNKTRKKSRGSVLFQTQSRCGLHTPIRSVGNSFSLSELLHTDNTTWDSTPIKTHRQTCDDVGAGPPQNNKKIKACKKLCPTKTYLGYSPRNSLQERAWCCHNNPSDNNVKHIKANYYNEVKKDNSELENKKKKWKTKETAGDTFTKKYPTTKPDKINNLILNILSRNFKKGNALAIDPADPAFIEFKYNLLKSAYDVEDIGTTDEEYIRFIKSELQKITIKQSTPDTPLVSNRGETGSDADLFSGLPFGEGDGGW